MQRPLSSNDPTPQPWLGRLDRVFGELNVFLVAVALGLGALDFVCFVTLRLVDTLAQLPKAG